tara:strand:- start:432 stop:632 length:201 start_codon:yes stop_codon:yes gene_type:complete
VSEVGEGIADLMEAFYAEGGDEVFGCEVGEGGAAVGGRGEGGGVGGLETGEEVNLRVGEGDSCFSC